MSAKIGSISCYIYIPDQLTSFYIEKHSSPPLIPSTPCKHVKENTDQEIKRNFVKLMAIS